MSPSVLAGGAIILVLIAGSIIFSHTFDSTWRDHTESPVSVTVVSPTPQLSQEASIAASPVVVTANSQTATKTKANPTTAPKSPASPSVISSVHIDGLQPSNVGFGNVAKLNGTGFGSTKGSIDFYYWEGKHVSEDEILTWDDGHISYVSKFPVDQVPYEIEVKTADGKVSNRFKSDGGTGEPKPTIYVLNPSNPVPGRDATIKGINLKNADKVYFYEDDKSYIGQDIGTSGILEHVRDDEVRYNMPGNLQPGKRYKMSVYSKYGTYGGLMSFTAGS